MRRQKLADMKAAGVDPFTITKFHQDAFSTDLKAEFAELPAESETGKVVSLAGRMMSKRIMGKASFSHLRDDKGDIQIFLKRDILGDEAYAAYKIVGSQESDPMHGIISEESPFGKALIGAKEGDTVVVEAPRGAMTYTLKKIER